MAKVKFSTTELNKRMKQRGSEIQDSAVPGLKFRAGKHRCTFNFEKRIRGQKGSAIQVRIGEYPTVSLEYARSEARRLANLCDRGIDPRNKWEGGVTLEQAVEKFWEIKKDLKAHTKKDYREVLRHQVPEEWLKMDFRKITSEMVREQFNVIRDSGIRSRCWKFISFLSSVWNGTGRHFRNTNGERILKKAENPAQLAKDHLKEEGLRKDIPKRPVIRDEHLGQFIAIVEEMRDTARSESKAGLCNLILLSLFTGFRFVEAQCLQWENMDLQEGYILLKGEDNSPNTAFDGTKNHQDHWIPLSTYPWELLKTIKAHSVSPYVFPSVTDHKKVIVRDFRVLQEITGKMGTHFSFHATRRTFASVANHIGISYLTIKRMLNHSTRGGDVTRLYIRDEFSSRELRDDFQKVCDYILDRAEAYRNPQSNTECPLRKLRLYAERLGFDPDTVTAAPLFREVV